MYYLAIIYEDSRHLKPVRILRMCTTHPSTLARENLFEKKQTGEFIVSSDLL